jgi:hypothetical protein
VFASREGVPKVERRWIMAFGFGLIHGVGFSFALRESLQFAGSHLALSLVSFNVGVEIGQILVLCIALPVLAALSKHVVAERAGTIIISAFVTHTAWHWLGDRWSALRRYNIELTSASVMPFLRFVLATMLAIGLALVVARVIRLRGSRIRGDAV